MKRSTLAVALAGAAMLATPAHAESIYEDWFNNANAPRLDGVNLSRALLQEQLDNGFFQTPPRPVTNIDTINNDTDIENQHQQNSTSIGNLQQVSISANDNCKEAGRRCTLTIRSDTQADQANDRSGQQAQNNKNSNAGQTSQTTDSGGNNTAQDGVETIEVK